MGSVTNAKLHQGFRDDKMLKSTALGDGFQLLDGGFAKNFGILLECQTACVVVYNNADDKNKC